MAVSFVKAGRKALLGRKLGMTQVYSEAGAVVPVTVLEVGPCTILQVKDEAIDGYSALQVGFLDSTKVPPRPQEGLFSKVRTAPKRLVREIPLVDPTAVSRLPLLSEVSGTVEYRDLSEGETLESRKVARSKLVLRTVVGPEATEDAAGGEENAEVSGDDEAPETAEADEPAKQAEATEKPEKPGARPALLIRDSAGKVVGEHFLPRGASIEVAPGSTVSDGDLLAYVPAEGAEELRPGMQLGVGLFRDTDRVDVSGCTKGRGFQGVVRRHGFRQGDTSHGSKNIREMKAVSQGTDPGRVPRGKKMPGQMGATRSKARALKVVEIDTDNNLMLVRGSVPGASGGYVVIQESLKG